MSQFSLRTIKFNKQALSPLPSFSHAPLPPRIGACRGGTRVRWMTGVHTNYSPSNEGADKPTPALGTCRSDLIRCMMRTLPACSQFSLRLWTVSVHSRINTDILGNRGCCRISLLSATCLQMELGHKDHEDCLHLQPDLTGLVLLYNSLKWEQACGTGLWHYIGIVIAT